MARPDPKDEARRLLRLVRELLESTRGEARREVEPVLHVINNRLSDLGDR
ncbi:MAG: hypothetical protein AAF192_01235 [Pseudomonadota bacterium]